MYKYRYNTYMEPKFKHDCTRCKFLGHGTYLGTPVDWYVCQGRIRTVIARYGNDGKEYSSAGIGEYVKPTMVEMAALAQGLDLQEDEKDRLLKQLLLRYKDSLCRHDYDNLFDEDNKRIGTSDWLSTKEV